MNDLASAIAVGKQMGEVAGTMAAAAKSMRVLLLAPMLVALALLRRDTVPKDVNVKKGLIDHLPRYLFGYIALAVIRAAGDRFAGGSAAWTALIAIDRFAVDWLMATVAAAIGLHLELRSLLSAGARAIAVGGAASCWMAGFSLSMIRRRLPRHAGHGGADRGPRPRAELRPLPRGDDRRVADPLAPPAVRERRAPVAGRGHAAARGSGGRASA